jgi:hypothetical protein
MKPKIWKKTKLPANITGRRMINQFIVTIPINLQVARIAVIVKEKMIKVIQSFTQCFLKRCVFTGLFL